MSDGNRTNSGPQGFSPARAKQVAADLDALTLDCMCERCIRTKLEAVATIQTLLDHINRIENGLYRSDKRRAKADFILDHLRKDDHPYMKGQIRSAECRYKLREGSA